MNQIFIIFYFIFGSGNKKEINIVHDAYVADAWINGQMDRQAQKARPMYFSSQ